MKVFIGFLLLASLAIAAVDEKEATPTVPESKKTDLLITANGQTIKLNTDRKGNNPIGLAASRFQRGYGRSSHRRMQNDQGDSQDGSTDGGQGGSNDASSGGSGAGGAEDESSVQEFEPTAVSNVADQLNFMLQTFPDNTTITLPRSTVETIVSMLDSFEAELESESSSGAGGSGNGGDSSDRVRRRRRSRVMRHSHHRRNRGFVRHHHTWARRQSVVHRSNFRVQRVVVNP